jgi:Ctr copper transporter family
MDGFQWTLKRQSSCLNFFFPSWTLNSTTKFVGAMICVIVLGVITEAIGRLRHEVNKKAHRRTTTSVRQWNRLWYLQTLLQGANALMAYILMLATMTYSLEILSCVVLGLMIGYFVFGGDLYNHAGTICCQFLEDEDGDGTVATMTGTLLRTLANVVDEEEEEDGDDSGRNQRTGQGCRSPTDHDAGERESCCNDHNGVTSPLQTRLLSEVA